MFNVNDVIAWRNDNYRLLAVVDDQVVLFPMNQNGIRTETIEKSRLVQAMQNSSATVIDDPYIALRFKNPTGRTREKMERNYALIRPVLDLGESVLISARDRSRALTALGGGDDNRRKASRLLSVYWKKGQCLNALLPDYGKNTNPRNCRLKPGRHFKDPAVCPPPVDETMRASFKSVIDKYVLKEGGISLKAAHSLLVNDYVVSHPGTTADTAPSLNQFRYFFKNYKTFPERLQAVTPANEYDKDKRSLHGDIYEIVHGVGHYYEIDSTRAGVFLVSERDRTQLIGEPTLYLVVDAYSEMIVGVYVGIEPAQYLSASSAIFNTCVEKGPFLEKWSDHLTDRDWQASGLPAVLAADNAELLTGQVEYFCRCNNVQMFNTKAYRGDQKSAVERLLGEVQDRTRPHLVAVPSQFDLKKEGAVDLRDKATLTLSEYRQMVLNAIVDINNRALTETPPEYPYWKEPTPIAIWTWCHQLGGGKSYLRRAPKEDLLRRSLMPRFAATVSREGIRAERISYTSDRARELGWFERDRDAPRTASPLLIIDPDNVSNAWVLPNENTAPADAWPCKLSAQSRRFESYTLFEVRTARDDQTLAHDRADREHSLIRGEMYRKNEALAKKAQKAQPKPVESRKERLQAIAENRRSERSYLAHKDRPAEAKQTPPRKPPKPQTNPYEFPDLDEIDE